MARELHIDRATITKLTEACAEVMGKLDPRPSVEIQVMMLLVVLLEAVETAIVRGVFVHTGDATVPEKAKLGVADMMSRLNTETIH